MSASFPASMPASGATAVTAPMIECHRTPMGGVSTLNDSRGLPGLAGGTAEATARAAAKIVDRYRYPRIARVSVHDDDVAGVNARFVGFRGAVSEVTAMASGAKSARGRNPEMRGRRALVWM